MPTCNTIIAIAWSLVLGAAIFSADAQARIGWFGVDDQSVRLELVTTSGPRTLPTWLHGVSVFFGNEQVGPAYGGYFAGYCCSVGSEHEFRTYAVFDLTALDSIVSASLVFYIPTLPMDQHLVQAPPGGLRYSLHGIPLQTEQLFFGGGEKEQFDILGNGPQLGSTLISRADEGTTIVISLNEAAIAYLEAARLFTGHSAFPNPVPASMAVIGGAVSIEPARVPTLSPWMVLLMVASLLGVGWHKLVSIRNDHLRLWQPAAGLSSVQQPLFLQR